MRMILETIQKKLQIGLLRRVESYDKSLGIGYEYSFSGKWSFKAVSFLILKWPMSQGLLIF
jgi:hypothetical protein